MKEKSSNEKNCLSVGINWYIPTNVKPSAKPYKQRIFF